MKELPKGHKKLLTAWAVYDWANSVYSLVIVTAIFPIFYSALFAKAGTLEIEVFGHTFKNSALVSFVTAIAFLVVAFLSPLLSGISDYVGNKKSFMRFFNYLGAISCTCLYWFNLENIELGLLAYFLGVVGFWGSIVFYNSYLPDIAFPEQQDAISAKGYSFGYAGGVVLLIFNLATVMKPEFFGISATKDLSAPMVAMTYSFITVGIWWILFSQYTYYYLPKGSKKDSQKITFSAIFKGFTELKKVWAKLEENRPLKRYLGGFFVYSMAVQTVMLVATYFGVQEIKWENEEQSSIGLIICILLIQLVAIVGAQLTAKASDKFGNFPVLISINIVWTLICLTALFISTPFQFYILAATVGLVMGGIQSLSRSTYSKLLPVTEDNASFFSFYDVSEKIGIVIGMLIYGAIDQITGSPRYAMVFLALFFIVGAILLTRVNKK